MFAGVREQWENAEQMCCGFIWSICGWHRSQARKRIKNMDGLRKVKTRAVATDHARTLQFSQSISQQRTFREDSQCYPVSNRTFDTGNPATDLNRFFPRLEKWTFRLLSSSLHDLENSTRTSNHVAQRVRPLSRFVWKPYSWFGTLLVNLMRKHRRCVNIFSLRTNWGVVSFSNLRESTETIKTIH